MTTVMASVIVSLWWLTPYTQLVISVPISPHMTQSWCESVCVFFFVNVVCVYLGVCVCFYINEAIIFRCRGGISAVAVGIFGSCGLNIWIHNSSAN